MTDIMTVTRARRAGGRLAGLSAVVTGAGSGIGEAIAVMFGAEGANVLCVGRRQEPLEATVGAICQAGGKAIAHIADVSDEVQAREMTERALAEFGAIDTVVANAGRSGSGSAADVTRETWDDVLAVNLTSKWLSFKYALPGMVERRRGSIIVMASIGGLVGAPGSFAYAASKGGCLAMTRQAAIDYAPYNVRVNAIAPGTVPTPLVRDVYERGTGMAGDFATADEGLRHAGTLYPLGRLGEPREVAYLATYLASDESAWTTGQTLVIDGGLTAR
jgi:NAD(P)-dependent dehydrogenase (short-subunit alcohol dehydrogenase family)